MRYFLIQTEGRSRNIRSLIVLNTLRYAKNDLKQGYPIKYYPFANIMTREVTHLLLQVITAPRKEIIRILKTKKHHTRVNGSLHRIGLHN